MSIQEQRKKRNLTQIELAQLMKTDQTAISQWETGRTKPTLDNLILLSKILKCSLESLINDNSNNMNIEEINDIFINQVEAGFTRVDLPTDFLQEYLCNLTNDVINKKEELKRMQIYNSYSNSKYQYITDSLESEIAKLEIVVDRIQQALE